MMHRKMRAPHLAGGFQHTLEIRGLGYSACHVQFAAPKSWVAEVIECCLRELRLPDACGLWRGVR